MFKTDIDLKQDIEKELQWDPKLNANQIGVSVYQGAVRLLGTVDTYAAKWAAEKAVQRIWGVRSLTQDLKVKVRSTHVRSDPEIAAAILSALRWHVFVPEAVTANVAHGKVTLEGKVPWNYQRKSAEDAVRFLPGVVEVFNHITLEPQVSAEGVHENVLAALQRQATADASSIHVETSASRVSLTGTASSRHSIKDATSAAWAAPGVTEVVSTITCP